MDELYDVLLFGDDASEQASVRQKLKENPDLARAWAHWRAVRARVRRRLRNRLPSRRLLVLYALDTAGREAALTAEEQAALAAARDDIEAALDAVPALQRVVDHIQDEQAAFDATWAEHTDGADPTPRAADAPTDSDRAPARRREAREPARRRRQWTRWTAVAALLVGAVALAVLFWPPGTSSTTVTVADGTTRTVNLADGTTVRLVGDATLRYPSNLSSATERRVTLSAGRAYFDVRRAKGGSFVVETPTATATVLGTQFGVLMEENATSIVLAEGRVRVGATDRDSSVVLGPGQRSRVARGQPPTPPAAANLTTALDWTGLFVFRGTPLASIAERLGRHHDASIQVAPTLRDEPVTGTFEQEQPLPEVLQALASTLGAEVRRPAPDQYRLVAR